MVFRLLLTPSSHHHPPLLTGDRKIKDTCKHKKETADDGPRRPLSAYNIFFSQMHVMIPEESEERIVETGNEEQLREFTLRACKDDAKVPRDLGAFTQDLMKKRQSNISRKRKHKKSHGKVSFLTLVGGSYFNTKRKSTKIWPTLIAQDTATKSGPRRRD